MNTTAARVLLSPEGAKSCSQGRKALVCGRAAIQKPWKGDIERMSRRKPVSDDAAPPGLQIHRSSLLPGARAPGYTTSPLRGYNPSGFTLLEVILALAILAGSLAALGEVMRMADQNAAMTRDETQAQIIAASIMDELVAEARPLTAVNQAAFDPIWDPQWVYSIAMEQTGYEELVAVRVLVEQQLDARLQPARFELVRWLPNPDFVPGDAGGQP